MKPTSAEYEFMNAMNAKYARFNLCVTPDLKFGAGFTENCVLTSRLNNSSYSSSFMPRSRFKSIIQKEQSSSSLNFVPQYSIFTTHYFKRKVLDFLLYVCVFYIQIMTYGFPHKKRQKKNIYLNWMWSLQYIQ